MLKYINFQSIPVSDQDRALAFYRDILGCRVHTDVPYEGGRRWIFLEIPGAETKIQFGERANDEQSVVPDLVLVSDNVDFECERIAALGVKIVQGPADAPWAPGTRWALIHDTENNMILIQTV